MSFSDRLSWLITGCVIGFVLGYLVRTVRDMKGELDEVDGLVKRKLGDRKTDVSDAGITRIPLLYDVVLIAVVALVAYAAFSSIRATNESEKVQESQGVFVACNTDYLSKTIRALNERTTYATEQAAANIELQRSQSQFVGIVLTDPPLSEGAQRRALERYYTALKEFIEVNSKVAQKAVQYPYPTNEELKECLDVP